MEMSPTLRGGRPTSAVPWIVYQTSNSSRTKASERARTPTKCTSFWTSGKVSRNTRLQVSPDPNLCSRLRDHVLTISDWNGWCFFVFQNERQCQRSYRPKLRGVWEPATQRRSRTPRWWRWTAKGRRKRSLLQTSTPQSRTVPHLQG